MAGKAVATALAGCCASYALPAASSCGHAALRLPYGIEHRERDQKSSRISYGWQVAVSAGVGGVPVLAAQRWRADIPPQPRRAALYEPRVASGARCRIDLRTP